MMIADRIVLMRAGRIVQARFGRGEDARLTDLLRPASSAISTK